MKQEIGVRLRSERDRIDWSQAQLATHLGIASRTIVAWEQGAQTPNAAHLAAISAAGIDVLYVITGQKQQQLDTALSRYAECWLAIDEAISTRKLALSAEKKKQAADALYQASSGNVNSQADLADILARIAA